MSENIAAEYEALLQFLYLAPVGLVQAAADGEIAMLNPLSAQLLMPLSPDGMLNNLFAAMESVAPELRNLSNSFAAPSGTVCDGLRVQLNASTGSNQEPKILSVTLLKLDADRLMAVIADITASAKRERQLKQSEAWFNAIMVGVTDYALMSLDEKGNVEQWNASIGRTTGHNANAVIGKPYSVFLPPQSISPERIVDHLSDAVENGWLLNEGWCVKGDGTQFWASTLLVPLDQKRVDEAESGDVSVKPGFALIIRDISDMRDVRDNLLKASLSDHLTGVANRRALFEAAETELKRWRRAPRPLSLLTLDADHFKRINDTYGHPAGDLVLQNLGATLLKEVGGMDIVARIGGEEFAVLLPSTKLADAEILAERIREAVSAQIVQTEDATIRYTVSIGISTMHENMRGFDMLLKLADQAMYAAKRNGRNRVETAADPAEAFI